MRSRRLLTGQRFGSLLILMEIEQRNSRGKLEVIAFCYACNNAKRMGKSQFSTYFVQSCGCQKSRTLGGTYRLLPNGRTRREQAGRRSRTDWRYGRSLKHIEE